MESGQSAVIVRQSPGGIIGHGGTERGLRTCKVIGKVRIVAGSQTHNRCSMIGQQGRYRADEQQAACDENARHLESLNLEAPLWNLG